MEKTAYVVRYSIPGTSGPSRIIYASWSMGDRKHKHAMGHFPAGSSFEDVTVNTYDAVDTALRKLDSLDRLVLRLQSDEYDNAWRSEVADGGESPCADAVSAQEKVSELQALVTQLTEAVQANLVFHTPIAMRQLGGEWNEYQLDAVRRTAEVLAKV